MQSGEDAELGLRLTRAGHRLATRTAMRVRHLGNPGTLSGFFRQQVWHGMGMFGTARGLLINKPTAMTVAYLLLHAMAIAQVFVPWASAVVRVVVAAALMLLVPCLAVAYRALKGGRVRNLPVAIWLYHVYFAARSTALVQLGLGRVRQLLGSRPGPEGQTE